VFFPHWSARLGESPGLAPAARRCVLLLGWPAGLLILLAVSWQRIPTLGGRVYLIVADATGMAAGLGVISRRRAVPLEESKMDGDG